MSRITVDPYIPLALWVPLALAAAGLLVAYAVASRRRLSGLRRRVILALMGVAVALPLAVLLNPTWMERVPPPPGKPLLTVLVDASASMDVADAGQGDSRFHEAARIAKAAAAGLKERYEVRLRAFAAESVPTTPQALDARHADGAATDLAAAVDQSMDEERPQGQSLLLLSDGIQNVGGSGRLRETMARAKALAVPVYTKVLGGPAEVRDLEVELKRPQEIAFIRQRVPVTVILRQRGSLAARARLQLLLDGKEVEKRWASIVPNGSTEEVFHVVGKTAGLFRYEVRAEPLPGELSAANNTASLLLRVVDEPVRVLLLEGKPYWDTKFLIRSLAMDESVELTAVVQLAPGRLLERHIARPKKKPSPAPHAGPPSANAPTAADQWTIEKDAEKLLADPAALASYQIVILGRRAEVFLSDESLAVLRKWLDKEDGSLVCFRGPPSSEINQRLDDLLPVRWTPTSESRFRAQWTEAGQDLHWLPAGEGDALAAMPSLAATARAEAKPYATTVLAASEAAAGQSAPVIAYRSAGALGSGRVVVVEGAGMWRWAFLPPEHQDRDELYGVFWRSLLRWLVTEEYDDLPEDAEILTYSPTEIAAEKVVALLDTARNEPRDLYDIWFLTSYGHVGLGSLTHAIEKKWEFRKKRPADAREVLESKEARYRKLWDVRLAAQMAELPEFGEVSRLAHRALRDADIIGRQALAGRFTLSVSSGIIRLAIESPVIQPIRPRSLT
jgi:hypothetical protein